MLCHPLHLPALLASPSGEWPVLRRKVGRLKDCYSGLSIAGEACSSSTSDFDKNVGGLGKLGSQGDTMGGPKKGRMSELEGRAKRANSL
eukprot:533376-Pelagomonas_calceolata.AAC.1